eukprot:GHRQ01033801.1.p1 GENE.GHRQ01033801.1~~GHRQ01033801.1.p1  ORF type:complete len:152 (-),score=57.69 GHRQ01033801.1:518-973(-)
MLPKPLLSALHAQHPVWVCCQQLLCITAWHESPQVGQHLLNTSGHKQQRLDLNKVVNALNTQQLLQRLNGLLYLSAILQQQLRPLRNHPAHIGCWQQLPQSQQAAAGCCQVCSEACQQGRLQLTDAASCSMQQKQGETCQRKGFTVCYMNL